MKICIIVLAHKDISYINMIATKNPEINFYIHVDLKANLDFSNSFEVPENIFFIKERVNVNWAGFSMVQATLNSLKFALNHDEKNQYFHLISGDDVLLKSDLSWSDDTIYMECINSLAHRYRLRFNTPHADTKYLRSLLGKVLTQFYKFFDKLLPTQENFYFGSQWFSIRRNELKLILNSITFDDLDFFRKKLCPDEHFFQYLVVKNRMLNKISSQGNRRFIIFDKKYQRGSSPIFLSFNQLKNARNEAYWFGRKVKPEVMSEFYSLQYDE